MIFSFLQRVLPGSRTATVMVDCLWYREPRLWRRILKHWQMRFCLRAVDRCVVWAERETRAYAGEFGIHPSKVAFVPHHSTLHPHRYSFTVSQGDYIFAGGNGDRDYETFVAAMREIDFPCVIACTDDVRFSRIELPSHIRRVKASNEEFRQWIAGCSFVVLPMQGGLLHSGGQQTFLNAMSLGKPVVVTDVEGGRSYIEHGVTGLLVEPGRATELRDAIAFLTGNPDKRRAMGERAMQAAQKYTVSNCYDRICTIADEVVATRSV
jgi:glycosyltransferase involved in cell wall biosynthesis